MHLLLNRHLTGSELEAGTRAQLAVFHDTKANTQKSLAAANEKLQNDPAIDTLISTMFEEVEG